MKVSNWLITEAAIIFAVLGIITTKSQLDAYHAHPYYHNLSDVGRDWTQIMLAPIIIWSIMMAFSQNDRFSRLCLAFIGWLIMTFIFTSHPLPRYGYNYTAKCMDDQRYIASLTACLLQDSDGLRYPKDWSPILSYPGMRGNRILICPASIEVYHQPGGYGLNKQVLGKSLTSIHDPASVFLIADSVQPNMIISSEHDFMPRHDGCYVVTYLDGYARVLKKGKAVKWEYPSD